MCVPCLPQEALVRLEEHGLIRLGARAIVSEHLVQRLCASTHRLAHHGELFANQPRVVWFPDQSFELLLFDGLKAHLLEWLLELSAPTRRLGLGTIIVALCGYEYVLHLVQLQESTVGL